MTIHSARWIADVSPQKKPYALVREEMESGNEVSEANGITQFAEGEPKRWMCI